MDYLFSDIDDNNYTRDDVFSALKEIGADDCDTLFIHSNIMFGKPADGFRKKDYIMELYQSIKALNVKNIIVPTFTFSFCNNEIYDVKNSKTSMGAFNDYVRKEEGRYRTMDPLLSFSVPNNLKAVFCELGDHSLGENSGFGVLNRMSGVKFLFFGAKQSESFTYIHYVEKKLDVPYRYDQSFTGTIIDYDGNSISKNQTIHTHCSGVKIPKQYDYFENELIDKKIVKKRRLGNSTISCIDKDEAYVQIVDKINNDPYYFVEGIYSESDLKHEYGFGKNGERVTHC